MSLGLMVVLGSPILCAVIWVIRYTGQWFYFYVWFFLCITSIFLMTVYPVYIAPLFNKVRMNSFGTKWKKQEHARKYHSYFWIFEKRKCRVNYDIIEPKLGLQDSEVTPNT